MRTLLLAGFLFISFYSNAQFTKGDKVLGGRFSFYSQSAPDNQNGGFSFKATRLSITPTMGFLLNENFAMGGQVGYASSFEEMSNVDLKGKSVSAGIFGQRYFNISDKFLFSLVGQFNFARGFETDYAFDPQVGDFTESRSQNYELTTSITPTFIFFPAPKWGFEASIGSISHTFNRTLSTDEKVNRFSVDYGAISFGVGYYFLKANR